MAHHYAPAFFLAEVCGLNRLSDSADLVDLEQECVNQPFLVRHFYPADVGDQQVVSHYLQVLVLLAHQTLVTFKIVLVKGVLNRLNRVPLGQVQIKVN